MKIVNKKHSRGNSIILLKSSWLWLGLLLLLGAFRIEAQGVQWTNFSDLPDSLHREVRPLLIFIHTDWCKYCALQDHNTFSQETVGKLVNERFYALRLNAESKAAIPFLNRTYRGVNDHYHELATFLAASQGQVAFPTTIILSEKFQLEKKWTGFVSPDLLNTYLNQNP